MTLTEFSTILQNAAIYYPQDGMNRKCKQLQAYAMVEDYSDLDAENLGKTILELKKGFFWSRKWAMNSFTPSLISFDYPLLAVFVNRLRMEESFRKSGKMYAQLEIYVIDQFKAEKIDRAATECEKRNPFQIIQDCASMLDGVFQYIDNVTYHSDGTSGVYMHPDLIAALKGNGQFALFNEQIRETRSLQNALRQDNKELQVNVFRDRDNETYGVYTVLNVPLDVCAPVTFDFTRANTAINPDYNRVKTDFGNANLIAK